MSGICPGAYAPGYIMPPLLGAENVADSQPSQRATKKSTIAIPKKANFSSAQHLARRGREPPRGRPQGRGIIHLPETIIIAAARAIHQILEFRGTILHTVPDIRHIVRASS